MTIHQTATATRGMSDSARGVLMMIAGVFVLTTQDAITKWMTAGYHAGEIMFWRGLFSFLPIALFAWRDGGLQALRPKRLGANLVRGVLALLTSLFIVLSFARLPLAEALAIVFASPLITTALSWPLLGERVGWRRWSAVLIGFAGVVVLTRPSPQGIAVIALLPLAAALFSALRDIATRRLNGIESSTCILFYTQLVATVAVVPSLVENSGWPSAGDLGMFAVSGILVGCAHWLIIRAFLLAEAATVAPLRYLALVYAALVGALVWGDRPDAWVMTGAGLIAGSGLYMLHRETRLRRPPRS